MHSTTAKRINQLRKLAWKDGVQAILVTKERNVKYLAGFTGDSTYLFLTKKNAILLSDTRYSTQIEEECPGFDVEIRDSKVSLTEVVAQVTQASQVTSLAIEAHAITKSEYDEFESRRGRERSEGGAPGIQNEELRGEAQADDFGDRSHRQARGARGVGQDGDGSQG